MRKTLHLTEGINEIVVTGGSRGVHASYFGNVTFTYMARAATENPAQQAAEDQSSVLKTQNLLTKS